MATPQSFVVTKSTATSTGSYCIRLEGTKSRSLGAFGANTSKKVYYLYSNQAQVVNTSHFLDTDKLITYKKPYQIPGGDLVDLEIITEILA